MTHGLPARLRALSGARRRLTLAVLGAMAALALPPVHLLPVLLVSVPALVWMWDGSRSRWGAFGAGWWWGLGWYAAGFYWIANALLIEPEKFGWMIPFATLGLGGLVACFSGTATWLAALPGLRGPARILLLAASWTLCEWLRTFVLSGFPWNPLGSVWDPLLPVLQVAALAGVHGLDLMTMLVFALPAVLADSLPRRTRLAAVAAAVLLPLAAWAWGSLRLAASPPETVPGVRLRLVQPAVAQAGKWQADLREANLAALVELSRRDGFDGVTAVVWPETASPFFLDLDEGHRAVAAAAAPPGGLLLAGTVRVTPRGQPLQVWNSLVAIRSDGGVAGIYDKVHLVPFGEYVPLRSVLPLAKITHGGVDFSPGPGPRTLTLPGLPPLSATICYEDIFPGAVVGLDQPRPQWLLNITNDGWFGLSAGPYQHAAAARMRAIEEGLPLVRDGNTGISIVFDGMGREVARLGLGERGSIDSALPAAQHDQPPYGHWGDRIPVLLICVVSLAALATRRRT